MVNCGQPHIRSSVLEEGNLGTGQGQVLGAGALGRGRGVGLWGGLEESTQKLPWLGTDEPNTGHLLHEMGLISFYPLMMIISVP